MRTLFAAALVAGLGFTTGCNKSEPGGNTATGDTFKIKADDLTLKPKDTKLSKLAIDRDKNYAGGVNFSVTDTPKGLKAKLTNEKIDGGGKETNLEVTADENAQPGDYVVKVTAKPEKGGKDTLVDVKVKVEKP